MRYTGISILCSVLFVFILSCRETMGEQHNSPKKEDGAPVTTPKTIEPPFQKDTLPSPVKNPKDGKTKKKKASDTLRPKVALL